MLMLPIKRKWFDMILAGENYDRLLNAFGMIWAGDELIRAPMPELQKNKVQPVAFIQVTIADLTKNYKD